MASSGKRKTTMAKLNRERKLVERRQEKALKKDARKRAAALGLTEPEHDPSMDPQDETAAPSESAPSGFGVPSS